MIKAVLFDLDDTLLGNHMDTFIPQYFSLLGRYAEAYLPRDQFLKILMVATQVMVKNTDPTITNRDAFWQSFTEQTGLNAAEMESFFTRFYENQFLQLESVVSRRETAVPLVKLCQQKGLKVVVATNPMFPSPAIEARLNWAGLPVAEFEFDLITTYENMHATKPHPIYYQEILDRIDVTPGEVLMVGDSWENDIEPSASLGCATYWLPMNGENGPPNAEIVTKIGTLEELHDLVSTGWLEKLGD